MSILLPGSPQSNLPEVYARSGWLIPQLRPKLQDERRVAIRAVSLVEELGKHHKQIKIRSTSPYPYNCVGMIFAARRAWIDIEHIYNILHHDGYRLIQRHEANEGDVVLYKQNNEPTHVGLVITVNTLYQTSSTVNILVLSKWGKDAEFIHFDTDVAYNLGIPSEFYTERPS